MGQAPKIVEAIRQTQAERQAEERTWTLAEGQLVPEADITEDPRLAPLPVQVPRQTFD